MSKLPELKPVENSSNIKAIITRMTSCSSSFASGGAVYQYDGVSAICTRRCLGRSPPARLPRQIKGKFQAHQHEPKA